MHSRLLLFDVSSSLWVKTRLVGHRVKPIMSIDETQKFGSHKQSYVRCF